MPNRILKESICTSETISRLTWFQEVFYYRLLVNCDDYGRTDARAKVLAGRLFPLADIPTKDIEDALFALTNEGLLDVYYVESKPYLQVRNWAKHQNVRARHSKYPAPEQVEQVEEQPQNYSHSRIAEYVSKQIKMSQRAWDELIDFMNDLPDEVIEWAVNESVEHGGNNWAYLRKVLAALVSRGVKTVAEAEARKKPTNEPKIIKLEPAEACVPEEAEKFNQEALDKLKRM